MSSFAIWLRKKENSEYVRIFPEEREERDKLDSLWCTTRSISSWNIQRPSRHQELTGQDQVEQIHQWIVGQVPLQTVTFLHLTCQLWPNGGDFCRKQRCTKRKYPTSRGLWEHGRCKNQRNWQVLSPRCSQIGIKHVITMSESWGCSICSRPLQGPKRWKHLTSFSPHQQMERRPGELTQEAKEANGVQTVLLDATWTCSAPKKSTGPNHLSTKHRLLPPRCLRNSPVEKSLEFGAANNAASNVHHGFVCCPENWRC